MIELVLRYAFQYAGYVLEATIFGLLLWQSRWRRLKVLCLYTTALLLIDGALRPFSLSYFGPRSTQYFYIYWLSDVVLALGAFLMVCGFFRRACSRDENSWKFVRLFLPAVFILVLLYTALNLSHHYKDLYTSFIVDFSQNVYFSCLVLNTLLYVMILQLGIVDEELSLLVCGLGVLFAGEAAGLALFKLLSGEPFAEAFFAILNPACSVGMYLIWIYAIVKAPQAQPVRIGEEPTPVRVEAN